MAARQEDQEDGGGLRRVRRLHRQPHDRAVLRARPASCWRKARCRSRSTGRSRSSAWRWGRSAWATWPATTSAGRSASAATSRSPTCDYSQDRRPAVRAGPLRPEDRRRLVRLRGRASATRIPTPVVDEMIVEALASELGITPRKIADEEIVERLRLRAGQRRRAILEEGIAQRASDIDMVYLTGYGFPLFAAARCSTPTRVGLYNVVRAMRRFAAEPHRRRSVLAAGAAARQARGRRQLVQPISTLNSTGLHTHDTDAVIVSTARTRLRQVLARRIQHDPRRHARRPRRQGTPSSAPASTRPRSRTCIMGCATARRRDRQQHRAPDRAARRPAGHDRRRHRQPLLLLGPADDRDGRAARHRRRGRRSSSPAASSRISCVQNEMNKHMLADPWLVEHKPEIYWTMLQTAETVAKRYDISRERQDEYGAASQQQARRGAGRRQVQRRDRADAR